MELMDALDQLASIYRGPSQLTALKSIFVAMIAGEPVLLIGPHGTFKSSMASFVGSVFDKSVATVKEDAKNFSEVEAFFERLGKELSVDPELLMQNRLDGVNVVYRDYPEYVRIVCEISLDKYKINADATRRPLSIYRCQLNEQMDPEDILGYAVHHKAILGNKPPHVIKESRLAGADYIVLDETFAAPRLMSKLHTAVNEKIVDTAIGPVSISPLTFVFCTNPWNQFYQTNPKIVNAATLDRFLMSAEVNAPSSSEVLYTFNVLRRAKITSRIPVDTIVSARLLAESVTIPSDILRLCVGLIASLSSCYFSPVEGDLRNMPTSPFMIDRDCSTCRFKNSICSIASVGKVRALLSLYKVMAASAAMTGKKEADVSDLEFAIMTALPHRLFFNDLEYLAAHGTIHAATIALANKYFQDIAQYKQVVERIMQVTKNCEWNSLLSLRKDVKDSPILRSLVDDLITMAIEAAKKKGKQVPEELCPPILIKEGLEAFTAPPQGVSK